MKVNVNTPLQSCEDCKWFSLDVDEAFMDGVPYPLWRCRYYAICENAIDLYKKEKGQKNERKNN